MGEINRVFCTFPRVFVFVVTTLPTESVHTEEVVVTTTTSETHAVVNTQLIDLTTL